MAFSVTFLPEVARELVVEGSVHRHVLVFCFLQNILALTCSVQSFLLPIHNSNFNKP